MSPLKQLEILAQRMKAERQKRGWTQSDLAEEAHLSLGAIRQIETCQRWPRPATLKAISAALKVDTGKLLGPTESPDLKGILGVLKDLSERNENLPSELLSLWQQLNDSDRQAMLEIMKARVFTYPKKKTK